MAYYCVSGGVTSTGIVLSSYDYGETYDYMDVFSGGTANSTTVKMGGNLYVSGGGTANSTTVDEGSMHVSSGGTANSTTVDWGSMYVSSGGTANDTMVASSGDWSEMFVEGTASRTIVNYGGNMYVSGGGSATDAAVYGVMEVSSGGSVQGAIVYRDGRIRVSGGTVNRALATGDNARIYVDDSGTLESAVAKNRVRMSVSGGGTIRYADVENTAQLYVENAGKLESASAGDWGVIYVFSGGSADDVSVDECGELHVGFGGTATRIRENGGCVEIVDGANVSFVGNTFSCFVLTSGSMTLHSGTTANATVVSNGAAVVYDGGCLQSADIKKGTLEIRSGGTATGLLAISDAAAVVVSSGGIVDFDISTADPGEAPRINDLSLVEGDPDFTITVSASQAPGTYALADGAAGFDKTVTIRTTSSDCSTITVGCTVTLDGQDYTLNLTDALLTLTVTGGSPVPVMGVASDLNGDGRADVVMSITQSGHGAEGATGAWLIQSDQTAAWGNLSQRNAGWEIFGTGLTSTGKSTNDVYVKSSDNVIGAWVTGDSGNVTGWETVGQFDDATRILGLGDFNADGQTDLLLRNVNGAVGCYFTSGEKTGWNYFQSLGDEWKIAAVGDLNGDGRDDVVLKHDAGFAGSWLTQSDGTMVWANLDTLPEGFAVIGAGDFDGDGVDDVLLKKGSYYGAWLVEAGSVKSWFGLGDLGDVTVEQIADFDGDGKDDLRIRTSAGDLGAQLVRAADTLEWRYYGSVGAEWSTSLAAI